MNSSRSLGSLDPAAMTAEQEYVLGQFLLKEPQNYYSRLSYSVTCPAYGSNVPVTYQFQLEKRIYFRQRATDTRQSCYEVVEKEIEGHPDRKVLVISGLLVKQLDGSVRYKQKTRGIKALPYNVHSSNEFSYAQQVKYIKAKAPRLAQNQLYQVMKWVKGQTLAVIGSQSTFTAKARLQTTINLLRCLDELHAAGIFHCDLKGTNIIVDPAKNYATKIIDFGSSTSAQNQKAATSGTRGYAAIEQRYRSFGPCGRHTDAFGVGRTLAFSLWDLSLNAEENVFTDEAAELKNLSADSEYGRTNLDLLPGLTPSQKTSIIIIIKHLTKKMPAQRATIKEALEEFENIMLDLELFEKKYSEHTRREVISANRKARAVRASLQATSACSYLTSLQKLQSYRSDINSENVFCREAKEEFFRVLDLEINTTTNIDALFDELETTHRSLYFSKDLEEYLIELDNLNKDLDLCSSLANVKELKKELFVLRNNIIATHAKVHNPKTLAEFMKETKKAKRKRNEYYQTVAALKAKCKQTVLAVRDEPFEALLSLSEKVESLAVELKPFQGDPALIDSMEQTAAFLNELKYLMEQLSDVGKSRDFINPGELQTAVANINYLLPLYHQRYQQLSSQINKALQKKTDTLVNSVTLFSKNSLHQGIKDWNLARDAANAQQLVSKLDVALQDKIIVAKKLNRETRHVCRKALQNKFADVFRNIDFKPSIGNKEIQILRGEIKAAIEKYIYNSTSRIGLWFNLRAASKTRITNMLDILNLTNNEQDVEMLRRKVFNYVSHLHGELAREPNQRIGIEL